MVVAAEERAVAVLQAVGAEAVTRAASGRYRRSEPIRPGVRYWATSTPRRREDHIGVQFYGVGVEQGRKLKARLEQEGFAFHRPQPGQLTFARPVPFGPDDGLDSKGLLSARKRLDALIQQRSPAAPAEAAPTADDLWVFMKSSPLADLELPDPDRSGSDRRTL